uniref:BPTI/Kunitz inhibitor domain-containing protein n=1 Tax=Anolis carolinensis TaxID=28377 RepID=A0A803SQR6_ANOCA
QGILDRIQTVSIHNFSISLGQDLLPSLCVMRVDRGVCRAQEKRFFYNYTIGKCRPFSYSGCGGNENNFTTRKSCLQMCKKAWTKRSNENPSEKKETSEADCWRNCH